MKWVEWLRRERQCLKLHPAADVKRKEENQKQLLTTWSINADGDSLPSAGSQSVWRLF